MAAIVLVVTAAAVAAAALAAGVLSGVLSAGVPARSPVHDDPRRTPTTAAREDAAPRPGTEAPGSGRPAATARTIWAGRPRLVRIPALGVHARVVPIPASGRVLTPPGDPTTAGWWSQGARPGAVKGSAVITGHTVSTGGGVFDDLGRLRAGDRVMVTTKRGRVRYRVVRVHDFRKDSFARHARRLFDQTVPGRLVLVTCDDWNGVGYLSNTVVVARPIRR